MNLEKYQQYSRIARGLEKADLVLKDARIVNVFTEEIIRGDIAIQDGIIAGIGSFHGKEERDLAGRYVCPGFIDSHLHLESTLVTPAELVTAASRHGTTTFIVDPHESANVSGLAGIDYILDQTEDVKANVYVMMPSCVPATAIDDNGCTLTAEDMVPYLHNSRILGLGEVMDSISVVQGEKSMHDKLELFEGRIRDGHAPFLEEGDLQAYAMAGIATDHECSFFDYAMRERRNGLTILVREGSAARNLEALVGGLVQRHMNGDGFCFCTDDKHIEDIQREGHIDHNVRKAIRLGMNPISAIKMATINAAKHFRLEDKIGSVAPGRFADILLIDDLTTMKPKLVLKSGRIVADENGARPVPEKAYPEKLFDTVHIGADFSAEKFIIHSEGKRAKCRVIDLIKDQIINKESFEWMDVKEGQIAADVDRDILKLAVVERYGKNGRVSTALVHGFGLKQGALAASVSHDHHNIVVVGTNDRDIAVCVEKLQELHGGFVSAVEGQVVDALALPLGGLMSTLPAKTVMKRMDEMNGAVEKMGCPMKAPFMSLSFISLPTVPELGLTDFGLIDVLGHQIIDMIVETEA